MKDHYVPTNNSNGKNPFCSYISYISYIKPFLDMARMLPTLIGAPGERQVMVTLTVPLFSSKNQE